MQGTVVGLKKELFWNDKSLFESEVRMQRSESVSLMNYACPVWNKGAWKMYATFNFTKFL